MKIWLIFCILCMLSRGYSTDNQSDVNEKFCELNKDHPDCESGHTHTHKYTKEDEEIHKNTDEPFTGDEDEPFFTGDEEIHKDTDEPFTGDEETYKDIDETFTGEERQKNILKTHYLNEEEQIFYPKKEGLARRNPVKVGHIQKVKINDEKSLDVKTLSLKPVMFEIEDFLTDEECDHIIKRAMDPNEGGMFSSSAKGGLTPHDEFKPTGKKGKSESLFGDFEAYDHDEDGKVNFTEIINLIHALKSTVMVESDVKEMFDKLGTTVFEDGEMTEDEFNTLDTIGLEEYIDILLRNDPRFKPRHSDQAWLFMEQWVDPTVHNIRERFLKLSGLERKIVYGGEMLQVVRYGPFGHYHAHHDSETHKKFDIPCCHQYDGDVIDSVGKCRLCRYITFVMYLNDIENGGETAFPVADNATYNADELRPIGNATGDKYNLSHGCKNADLVINPKKRSAIFWYNHLINGTTGWMGELDLFSLHGGCDVVKGEKWISNMWIPAPYSQAKDKDSIYLNKKDFELAQSKAADRS